MSVLTAIILTFNEQDNIADAIESVRFTDRIIVFDSLSTDQTAALARSAGAEVILHRFENYASQRNAALEAAHGQSDWVLFLDADERVTPELAQEIRACIALPGYTGYRIPRHNFIFGKLTLGAGWYPDYQTRLLKVGAAHFDPNHEVHEIAILDGEVGTVQHPFIHYNYRTFAQFLAKQFRYARIDAETSFKQGIHPALRQIVTLPLRQFWWRYVTLKGYSDGFHGLRMSLLMAWYEFYRLRLLMRLWQQRGAASRTVQS